MESTDVRITSLDVARTLGFKEGRRKSGNWVNFCCPFCGDTKYRLGVNLEKGGYKCFHCGAKGTPLNLYAQATRGKTTDSLNATETSDLIREMTAACGGKVWTAAQRERWLADQRPEIHAAQSGVLDKTYRTLLALPSLRLTAEHRANLVRRGLDDAAIDRNGYASFTSEIATSISVKAKNANRKFNELKSDIYRFDRMKNSSSASVISGMVLAATLLKCGCELQGVPGFFKVNGTWILNLPEGMLIPTRNSGGQIVGIQVRRDGDASPRYLTVSSNRLPSGVTTGISRAHFPIGNAPLEKGAHVYLTEGPLKADIALHLIQDDKAAFIAIQGVTNTKMLDNAVFPTLKERGVTSVINALDMDKLTNPGVMAACADLKKMAQKHGIEMEMLCWDAEYATQKEEELSALCKENKIAIPIRGNVFKRVGAMALSLHRKGIRHSVVTLPNGKAEKHYWNNSEKGIDDHLLRLRNNAKTV